MTGYNIEEYVNFETKFVHGYSSALLGFDPIEKRMIYSYKKMIKLIIRKYDFSRSEAIEVLEKLIQQFSGDNSPIWCYDDFE